MKFLLFTLLLSPLFLSPILVSANIDTDVWHENGEIFIQWDSVSGNNYSIYQSTNLVDDNFNQIAASQINASSSQTQFAINADNESGFYRVNPETPLTTGSFSIIQSWSQETNFSRSVQVSVPWKWTTPCCNQTSWCWRIR